VLPEIITKNWYRKYCFFWCDHDCELFI